MFSFEILTQEEDARAGKIATPHGTIQTPSFVAVGTQGTVNSLSVEDLREIGTELIITNSYHLHLRPGEDVIERMGGLHRFTGVGRAIDDRLWWLSNL